jgi:hypothetical protein
MPLPKVHLSYPLSVNFALLTLLNCGKYCFDLSLHDRRVKHETTIYAFVLKTSARRIMQILCFYAIKYESRKENLKQNYNFNFSIAVTEKYVRSKLIKHIKESGEDIEIVLKTASRSANTES